MKEPLSVTEAKQAAKRYREVLVNLASCHRDIVALSEMPGAQCVNMKAIEVDFTNLMSGIRAGLFSKVCTVCHGHGCRWCKDRGWYPAGVFHPGP